jgi:hypothetical protein
MIQPGFPFARSQSRRRTPPARTQGRLASSGDVLTIRRPRPTWSNGCCFLVAAALSSSPLPDYDKDVAESEVP